MEIIEVILLVVGGIIFVASFVIPEKKNEVSKQTKEIAKDEISAMVNQEMENVRTHVDDVVEEAVTYAMEKTERSLERISNEKIMATITTKDFNADKSIAFFTKNGLIKRTNLSEFKNIRSIGVSACD